MAVRYASIIIDISHESVDRVFQYRIPEELLSEIQVGTQVSVPFGKGDRIRKGYVVDITDTVDYDPERVKTVQGIVEKSITADVRLIRLAWWMKERYGSTMNQALKTVLPVKKKIKARNQQVVAGMMEDGWEKMKLIHSSVERNAVAGLRLTPEQQEAADVFSSDYRQGIFTTYLLHGITGSGKTEVYMEMIRQVLAAGRQVIVLIPEIALTYQTVMRFYRHFGESICVMHSRLAAGERYDQFEKARDGSCRIMIGARSALFAPFPDLGLIIIDEEHEGAYASDVTPRYHARDVAQELCRMSHASLVLGSATPSMETYAKAEAGIYRLLRLTTRAAAESKLAQTEIVDLREEMKSGNKSIFSHRLQELIRQKLDKKEQVMLFMNRRGYSSFVSCRSCGEAVKCPHCDVTLTLHNRNRLLCHYCGYSIPMPKKCPACGSSYLAGFGVGTQKIEELTKEMFPDAKVLRMDLDTTSGKTGHERILSSFAKGDADILIGTQMIVKGHDFPRVTLVGILAADTSLYAPDYRSSERTFQLLVQAAGRAGRGDQEGIAVIQTYAPEHYSIQTSAAQDYETFYSQEMGFRKIMAYPPSCHMLTIQVAGKDDELTGHMMDAISRSVEQHFGNTAAVIGPVPAPVYKVNDIYRKILYLKHENYDILVRIQKYIQKRWDETEECKKLNIQYGFE